MIDLGRPEGQSQLHALARDAQALVTNLRPSAIRKLGLTYEALREVNPALVCVALTGFGIDSPYADRPAYDYVIQAMTGVMELTGEPDSPPTKTGYSAVDNSAGMMGALGLLAKLVQRQGGQVDIAMYDVMLSQLNYIAAGWLNSRRQAAALRALGASLHGSGAGVSDARWLADPVHHPRRFLAQVQPRSRPAAMADGRKVRLDGGAARQSRRGDRGHCRSAAGVLRAQDWMSRLVPLGVVAAEVSALEHALTSEQTRSRNMVVEIATPGGTIRSIGNPVKTGCRRRVPAAAAARRAQRPAFKSRDAMNARGNEQRRAMSKALTRAANASVADVLTTAQGSAGLCGRIGVTGPPGAGKSSLIAALARRRLQREGDIAILAIDPTSPVSGGAILGDRIRMEDLAQNPRVYIRSLASRRSHDGLADNLPDMLEIVERAGFVEADPRNRRRRPSRIRCAPCRRYDSCWC